MPINPRSGEDRVSFIARCIRQLKSEDPTISNDQATGICFTKWSDKKMKKQNLSLQYSMPITESVVGNKGEFVIKGTAINSITTRNGITYLSEELESASSSLRNKPILKDHKNEIDSIIGRTTNNTFFDFNSNSLKFEGRIMDAKVQQMIKDGRINNVSVGALVKELEETEEGEVRARGIEFVEISLVAIPADPGAGLSNSFSCALQEAYHDQKKELSENSQSLSNDKDLAESSDTVQNVAITSNNNLEDEASTDKKEEGSTMSEEEDKKQENNEEESKEEPKEQKQEDTQKEENKEESKEDIKSEEKMKELIKEAVKLALSETITKKEEKKGKVVKKEESKKETDYKYVLTKEDTINGTAFYATTYDEKYTNLKR